jgi:hypothetical protein
VTVWSWRFKSSPGHQQRYYQHGFTVMRRSSIYAVLLAAICGMQVACATSSNTIDPYVQKLQWLDSADPQADANQAVKQNDLRLLGLATRSVNIPGIKPEDTLKYEEQCGVQLIEGISDVVRSDEHLRLMQKARSYALQYNAIIKIHCQP